MTTEKIIWWSEEFLPKLGGGPIYINTLIKNLPDYNHQVVTQAVRNHPSRENLSDNLLVNRFPSQPQTKLSILKNNKIYGYLGGLFRELQCLRLRMKYLRRSDFDFFFLLGLPMYSKVHRFRNIMKIDLHRHFVDYSFITKPKLMILCNLPQDFDKKPGVTEAYNHYIDQFENIICLDKHIYDYCMDYISSTNISKNVWFIPIPINTRIFSFKPFHFKGMLKVGFAGRLANTVDLEMINWFLSNMPSNMVFHLAVTGDINLIKIPNNVGKRVKLLTDVSPENMPSFYHDIHILFNPTLHKGVPTVSLEAMACGRPVIMYNIGNKYLPDNGENGFLINQDKQQFIALLSELAENPEHLKKVGSQASVYIQEKCSTEVIIPQIKQIVDHLLKN